VTVIEPQARTLKFPLLVRSVIFFSLFASALPRLILLLSKEGNSGRLSVRDSIPVSHLRHRSETVKSV